MSSEPGDPRAALERLLAETKLADATEWVGNDGAEQLVAALLAPDARQHLLALLAPTPEEIGMECVSRGSLTWRYVYPAPTPEAT